MFIGGTKVHGYRKRAKCLYSNEERSWWCYNQENHPSLDLFLCQPMTLTNAI
ncbi:unnamed protein product [Brassica oleracea]